MNIKETAKAGMLTYIIAMPLTLLAIVGICKAITVGLPALTNLLDALTT